MVQEIGQQYKKDSVADPSGFLAQARLHQSRFRATVLDVPFDERGNYLQKDDAWEQGLNFYDDFGIFDAVKKRFPMYSKPLYANMLRSEHIPFNLFIPFKNDYDFCKVALSKLTSVQIRAIDEIKIEYAPKPASKYLNDRTSFDVYVEYTHVDGAKGILGIEVKYTERSYKLTKESKEETDINNLLSKYYTVMDASRLYKPEAITLLKTDRFRQMWRNQLLGESMLTEDKAAFKHFTSVVMFPQGNKHFVEASKDYIDLLARNDHKFVPVTYEYFLDVCEKHCPNERFGRWISYLRSRYIVQN